MERKEEIKKVLSPEEADRFASGVMETVWSQTGEPHYVIREGLDLKEFALLAKRSLETERIIAHDFTSYVINPLGERADFEYKSGWFLDGLADGEIE